MVPKYHLKSRTGEDRFFHSARDITPADRADDAYWEKECEKFAYVDDTGDDVQTTDKSQNDRSDTDTLTDQEAEDKQAVDKGKQVENAAAPSKGTFVEDQDGEEKDVNTDGETKESVQAKIDDLVKAQESKGDDVIYSASILKKLDILLTKLDSFPVAQSSTPPPVGSHPMPPGSSAVPAVPKSKKKPVQPKQFIEIPDDDDLHDDDDHLPSISYKQNSKKRDNVQSDLRTSKRVKRFTPPPESDEESEGDDFTFSSDLEDFDKATASSSKTKTKTNTSSKSSATSSTSSPWTHQELMSMPYRPKHSFYGKDMSNHLAFPYDGPFPTEAAIAKIKGKPQRVRRALIFAMGVPSTSYNRDNAETEEAKLIAVTREWAQWYMTHRGTAYVKARTIKAIDGDIWEAAMKFMDARGRV